MVVKKPKTLTDSVEFVIKVSTILLIKGPRTPHSENILASLRQHLHTDYDIEFDTIRKSFTMVTDVAAVMARFAWSSVSSNIAQLGEG